MSTARSPSPTAGQPVHRIATEVEPDTALIDATGRNRDEVRQLITTEYRRPYDLEHDRLLRFRLVRLAPVRWVIVKAVHHIISDAVSAFTFLEELLTVYDCLRTGRPETLSDPTASYLGFLNRQNQSLAGPDADRMLTHWRDHLPARMPPLDLPTDKPRPAVRTDNGASQSVTLDADLCARVRGLAGRHDTTVFVVLLTAYYLLLHRYYGQDGIIVGTPVTSRTRKEFDPVYGYLSTPCRCTRTCPGSLACAS